MLNAQRTYTSELKASDTVERRETNLGECVIVIENKRRNKSTNEQKLDFEGIQIRIVSGSEGSFHEVENVNRTGNEENLHYSIV